MRRALDDAELAPSDIEYLNAHGTATTINDANETHAIKEVFGNHAKNLAISSTKSMHGHPLGAGGGIEAVACIKAMQRELGAARPSGSTSPIPSATSTTSRTWAATSRSTTRCRTRSPSAASTRCWSSARRRPEAADFASHCRNVRIGLAGMPVAISPIAVSVMMHSAPVTTLLRAFMPARAGYGCRFTAMTSR